MRRIAATMLSSETVTTLSTCCWISGKFRSPSEVRSPSAIVVVFSSGMMCPAAKDRAASSAPAGSAAITRMPGRAPLAATAVPQSRPPAATVPEPEVLGLLALMLLHHARRDARRGADGSLVLLSDQDRSRWDIRMVAEGIGVLQRALAADRLGEFQAQAAIAALHADARRFEETDWPQIVGWYDELLVLTGSPVVALNRAIAVGEADGGPAGLRALAEVDPSVPRWTAARAHLLERAGWPEEAAEAFAVAAQQATSTAERDVLTRRAARLRETARG